MSDHLPSSSSSCFNAWLASNPPRVHSRRRSQPEGLSDTGNLRTSSPPPAKRVCLRQSKSAPVFPKSCPVSGDSSSTPAPFGAPPSTISAEVPKQLQPRRKPPSYVKRRAKRIIRIINATFAVCEGKPASSLAYPVHRIDVDNFLIPATRSDFETLRQYQGRSNALWAITRFERKAVLPGSTPSTPCISVKMPDFAHESLKTCVSDIGLELERAGWTLNGEPIEIEDCSNTTFRLTLGDQASQSQRDVEPDGSLRFAGVSFPFLVAEIANTQTEPSLDKKIHYWTYGSRQHLKFIVIFRIVPNRPTGYRVLVSVDKLGALARPTTSNPHGFIMEPTHIIVNEEIYPKTSAATFDITLADVLPENANGSSTPVTVGLRSFGGPGKRAVRALVEKQNNLRAPSPRDPNEESAPSPAVSDHESTSSSFSSNNDIPADRSYKGKAVDRGDSRGVGTRQSSNRMS